MKSFAPGPGAYQPDYVNFIVIYRKKMVQNTRLLERKPWIRCSFNLDPEPTTLTSIVCRRSNLFSRSALRLGLQKTESKCLDQEHMISNHQFRVSHHLNSDNLSDLSWQVVRGHLVPDVKLKYKILAYGQNRASSAPRYGFGSSNRQDPNIEMKKNPGRMQ